MEAPAPAPIVVGGRREPSTDPVKAQGILTTITRKECDAARQWHEKWGFYTRMREIQEEEAVKLGLSLEEYRAAVKSVDCQPEPRTYPVVVDPSPKPLPPTSAAMVGRRATCPLERYGRLVKTDRDFPSRPPLPPGQIYDPFKQTLVFLGSVEGDPISYKLPAARCEIQDDMWATPRRVDVMPLSYDFLQKL
ncbi:uncharacterized protein LOC106135025 isoform X1 [Amyelois transitella]|uniref:uncharacterized protein LOC106135025 isoform X1 n=1 Tax=Amyelois transitella TaxID=680683 RepID=UPI0029905463|nr:uncharacterized protein LOC106135025 isoform X1 [Amyelois transitella]XP_060802714.1 uncharacterized protein LOC106135025 isoform X1 [Amyelois transitella]